MGNQVLRRDTVLPASSIRATLLQETVRRLLNNSVGTEVEQIRSILSKYAQKLINSGHSQLSTKIFIVQGVTKYLHKVKLNKKSLEDSNGISCMVEEPPSVLSTLPLEPDRIDLSREEDSSDDLNVRLVRQCTGRVSLNTHLEKLGPPCKKREDEAQNKMCLKENKTGGNKHLKVSSTIPLLPRNKQSKMVDFLTKYKKKNETSEISEVATDRREECSRVDGVRDEQLNGEPYNMEQKSSVSQCDLLLNDAFCREASNKSYCYRYKEHLSMDKRAGENRDSDSELGTPTVPDNVDTSNDDELSEPPCMKKDRKKVLLKKECKNVEDNNGSSTEEDIAPVPGSSKDTVSPERICQPKSASTPVKAKSMTAKASKRHRRSKCGKFVKRRVAQVARKILVEAAEISLSPSSNQQSTNEESVNVQEFESLSSYTREQVSRFFQKMPSIVLIIVSKQ